MSVTWQTSNTCVALTVRVTSGEADCVPIRGAWVVPSSTDRNKTARERQRVSMWVSRLNIAQVDEISVWRRVGKTGSVHARGPCTALAATVPQPCIFYIPTATSGQHYVFCLCHPFGSNSCFFSCVFVLDHAATFGTHVEPQGIYLLLLNASLRFILFLLRRMQSMCMCIEFSERHSLQDSHI